jgi:hypothetical protein
VCCVLQLEDGCAGEVGAGILTLNNIAYYIIAGEHPKEEVAKNGVTMILDLTNGIWHEGAMRPGIGNHHAAEVINNKLYLFGGLSGGEQDVQIGTLVAGASGPDIEWTLGAPLPFASGSAASAVIGGKVSLCYVCRVMCTVRGLCSTPLRSRCSYKHRKSQAVRVCEQDHSDFLSSKNAHYFEYS